MDQGDVITVGIIAVVLVIATWWSDWFDVRDLYGAMQGSGWPQWIAVGLAVTLLVVSVLWWVV